MTKTMLDVIDNVRLRSCSFDLIFLLEKVIFVADSQIFKEIKPGYPILLIVLDKFANEIH